MVNPKVRSALIEITGSVKYSIADNPTTLWVSGAAGWFEVRTAPEYMTVYLEIRQAIVLFYEAQDVYMSYQEEALKKMGKKKAAKPQKPPPLDQIFFKVGLLIVAEAPLSWLTRYRPRSEPEREPHLTKWRRSMSSGRDSSSRICQQTQLCHGRELRLPSG